MVFGLFKKTEAQVIEKNFSLITSTDLLPTNFDILHEINFNDFKTIDDIAEHAKMDKNFIRFIYLYDDLVQRRFINLDPDTRDNNYSYQDMMTHGHNERAAIFLLVWHKDTNKAMTDTFIKSKEEKMKKYQLLDIALQERGYPFKLHDDRSLEKEVKLYTFEKKLAFFERTYYKPKESNHFRLKQIYNIFDANSTLEIIDYDYDGKKVKSTEYKNHNFIFDEKLMQSFSIKNMEKFLK
tara:strand:- start:70 stop:783 length:714 start_codon:yes stop_codon:yes gene_type:complete